MAFFTPAHAAELRGSAAHAVAALLGAAVGDAAGAYLEFAGRPDTDGVQRALQMPGGGVWRVAPGQITDDTELAICQADGLLAASEPGALDLDALAGGYRSWIASRPFDIGNATRAAFGSGNASGAATKARAAAENGESKANGATMRATPISVFAHRLPPMDAFAAGAADASLSHPNAATAGANGAYVAAVAHLVAHPGDAEGAFAVAESCLAAHGAAYAEAAQWLSLAKQGVRVPYHPQAGFLKIAFTHAFRHLAARTPLRAALEETLLGGGDTDTNAAIVGGMLGALHGVSGVEPALWMPVLGCNTALGQPRPEWLSAGRLPDLAARLLAVAPTTLKIVSKGA